MTLTGDLEADIRYAAVFIQRAFELPASAAMLPEIVRGVLAHPPELSFDKVVPRRRDFARTYQEQAAAEGFDPALDPFLAFDMVLGTAIAYLLANGHAMSEAKAKDVGNVIVKGLRIG